jgi:hypothetical protein
MRETHAGYVTKKTTFDRPTINSNKSNKKKQKQQGKGKQVCTRSLLGCYDLDRCVPGFA